MYQAAHTQVCRLSHCLAKPAHPACWDKFLGRQCGLQVRCVRVEEQHHVHLLSSLGRSKTKEASLWTLGGSSSSVGKERTSQSSPLGLYLISPFPEHAGEPSSILVSLETTSNISYLAEPMVLEQVKSEKPIEGGLRQPPYTHTRRPGTTQGIRRIQLNSPKWVSGGEVSRDGQVTPHLLPTPNQQSQLQTRLGVPQAAWKQPP